MTDTEFALSIIAYSQIGALSMKLEEATFFSGSEAATATLKLYREIMTELVGDIKLALEHRRAL